MGSMKNLLTLDWSDIHSFIYRMAGYEKIIDLYFLGNEPCGHEGNYVLYVTIENKSNNRLV